MIAFWPIAPLLLAAIPQTVFVAAYTLPVLGAGHWWADSVGRALAIKSASLAVVLDILALRVLDRGWPSWSFAPPTGWLAIAQTVGYWLVLLGVCYQAAVLLRQRLGGRDGPAASRP